MYKAVFQNRKFALVFAGMTIFGAITTVGSQEEEGTLSKTLNAVSRQGGPIAESSRGFAATQVVPDKAVDPNAGWGSGKPAVFGNYGGEDGEISGLETSGAAPPPAQNRQPGAAAPSLAPSVTITSRQMTQKPN